MAGEVGELGWPIRPATVPTIKTGADGKATIHGTSVSLVAASAPGLDRGFAAVGSQEQSVTLRLSRLLVMQCTVRDRTGTGVPNLSLHLRAVGQPRESVPGETDLSVPAGQSGVLVTDRAGRVRLSLASGQVYGLVPQGGDWSPVGKLAAKTPWGAGWRLTPSESAVELEAIAVRFLRAAVRIRGQEEPTTSGHVRLSPVRGDQVTYLRPTQWPALPCDAQLTGMHNRVVDHTACVALDGELDGDRVDMTIHVPACKDAVAKLKLWTAKEFCSPDLMDVVEVEPLVTRDVGSVRVDLGGDQLAPRSRELHLTYDDAAAGGSKRWSARGRRLPDGRWLFVGIPAGPQSLTVMNQLALASVPRLIEVPARAIVDLQLSLPPAQGVRIWARSRNGQAIASVDGIRVLGESNRKQSGSLSQGPAVLGTYDPVTGAFLPEVFYVTAGSFRLYLERDGRNMAESDVFTVKPGTVVELQLQEK